MANDNAKLDFELGVKGNEAVERALRSMEKRVQALEKAQTSLNDKGSKPMKKGLNEQGKALKDASKNTAAYNRGLAQSFNELTEVTFALGSAIPSMRSFGMAAANAGNSSFMLTSRIGALGIAAGAAIGFLPVLVGLIVELAGSSDDAADSAEGWGAAMDEVIDRIEKSIEAQERLNALWNGTGGIMETQIKLGQVNERAATQLTALDTVLEEMHVTWDLTSTQVENLRQELLDSGRDMERIRTIIRETVSQQEKNEHQIALVAAATVRVNATMQVQASLTRSVTARVKEETQAMRSLRKEMELILLAQAETAEKRELLRKSLAQDRQDRIDSRDPDAAEKRRVRVVGEVRDLINRWRSEDGFADAQAAEERALVFEESSARKIAAIERENKAMERQGEVDFEAFAKVKEAGTAAMEERKAVGEIMGKQAEQVAGLTLDMFSAIASGEEGALHAFLQATAERNAVLALERTAIAIFSTYFNPPGAAAAWTAAAMHASIAATAGVGMAGVAAAGGATSRRAPAPGNDESAGGIPPTAIGGNEGGSGGGTVVINFNSPVDEAQQGRLQARARRAAERRHGRV